MDAIFYSREMARFAVMLNIAPSTFKVMTAVCRSLLARGHEIIFFDTAEHSEKTRAAGFEFMPWGVQAEIPTVLSLVEKHYKLQGFYESLPILDQFFSARMKVIFDELPDAFKKSGIDCLIADQHVIEARTLAELSNIPFVTVSPAIPLLQESRVPPSYESFPYSPTLIGRIRNRFAYRKWNNAFWGLRVSEANHYRKRWGLPAHSINDSWSPYAQITQMPKEFDYPRNMAPPHLHYVGPLDDPFFRKNDQAFSFEKLTGQPLVYASMGTTSTLGPKPFYDIAQACAKHPVQLLMSLGNPKATDSPKFSGTPLVVNYVPQLEVLKRTAVFITHGGLNSGLESLAAGIPMLVLPSSVDQFGVAGRVKRLGAGEFLNPPEVNADRIEEKLRLLLDPEKPYRKNAQAFTRVFSQYPQSAERAANIIERVNQTRKPVLA